MQIEKLIKYGKLSLIYSAGKQYAGIAVILMSRKEKTLQTVLLFKEESEGAENLHSNKFHYET